MIKRAISHSSFIPTWRLAVWKQAFDGNARARITLINGTQYDFSRAVMTIKKKEFESELVVANILTKNNKVTLDLRFTKPRFEEPTEKRLAEAIEPIPKSPMEKMGRDYMRGAMNVAQRQLQQQMQPLIPLFPRAPTPDTIRITLSKQEYEEIGRPTVFDKLILKLSMKHKEE